MKRIRNLLAGMGVAFFLLLIAPLMLLAIVVLLALADVVSALQRRTKRTLPREVSKRAVSVVIPTWNGREHLARNLPSVVRALATNPENEILVLENGSEDGTAEFLAESFPTVRVVEMGSNLGFGRASNYGFTLARNDIVVLLNNDMRVEADFLKPLVDGFRDPRVFAVTAQIVFADPAKPREETGLTLGRWVRGGIHLQHVADEQVDELFPTFFAGGGSTAYDRLKVLELGGYDETLAPFYMEDVDLSYMAWKRGWINLYAPASLVRHEHRGTIGRHFSRTFIDHVVRKNRLLFVWKNMHHWGRLLAHFCWLYADMWASLIAGPSPSRPDARAFLRAAGQSLRVAVQRGSARRQAEISDAEAFRRPLGGFFRDRYHRLDNKPEADLNVLLVSPYPIEPPTHGGAVFMKQAAEGLAGRCRLHLLCLVERPEDVDRHARLAGRCASAELVLHDPRPYRGAPALWPQAARAYWDPVLLWKIHRTILLRRIDVVQLEYAQMASYGERFRQVVCCLFEHDLHFQSVQRSILSGGLGGILRRGYEYLRCLRFELQALRRLDAIQVCSADQRRVLSSLLGASPPVLDNLRTAIDVSTYPYQTKGREPDTMLFVGNFRHPPNVDGLLHFRREILPLIRKTRPQARLVVVGADATDTLRLSLAGDGVEFLGPVADIRDVLSRYAVFVAPILYGSGVRVKILEAFACGIPVVSTSLGVEGLCDVADGMAEIADKPREFAAAVVLLLSDRRRSEAQVHEARKCVIRNWDSGTALPRLLAHYRAALETKLLSPVAYPPPLR